MTVAELKTMLDQFDPSFGAADLSNDDIKAMLGDIEMSDGNALTEDMIDWETPSTEVPMSPMAPPMAPPVKSTPIEGEITSGEGLSEEVPTQKEVPKPKAKPKEEKKDKPKNALASRIAEMSKYN